MIVGIGNDIIEVSRIKEAIKRKGFLERYFTESERLLFAERKMNVETIAGNFAAKESVSKVLGTGISGFSLHDIEVLRDTLGRPIVTLYNEAEVIQNEKGIQRIWVSISHSKKYANAVAIGEHHDHC